MKIAIYFHDNDYWAVFKEVSESLLGMSKDGVFVNKEDLLFLINKLSKAIYYKQTLENYSYNFVRLKISEQTFEQFTACVPEITLEDLFINDEVDALLVDEQPYFNSEHYFIDTEKEEILWM